VEGGLSWTALVKAQRAAMQESSRNGTKKFVQISFALTKGSALCGWHAMHLVLGGSSTTAQLGTTPPRTGCSSNLPPWPIPPAMTPPEGGGVSPVSSEACPHYLKARLTP
jgi:hypothetical protein